MRARASSSTAASSGEEGLGVGDGREVGMPCEQPIDGVPGGATTAMIAFSPSGARASRTKPVRRPGHCHDAAGAHLGRGHEGARRRRAAAVREECVVRPSASMLKIISRPAAPLCTRCRDRLADRDAFTGRISRLTWPTRPGGVCGAGSPSARTGAVGRGGRGAVPACGGRVGAPRGCDAGRPDEARRGTCWRMKSS